MRRYRLIFNFNESKYNGGAEYDIETSSFYVPDAPIVIKELSHSLASVSKAVVRVYCFDKVLAKVVALLGSSLSTQITSSLPLIS